MTQVLPALLDFSSPSIYQPFQKGSRICWSLSSFWTSHLFAFLSALWTDWNIHTCSNSPDHTVPSASTDCRARCLGSTALRLSRSFSKAESLFPQNEGKFLQKQPLFLGRWEASRGEVGEGMLVVPCVSVWFAFLNCLCYLCLKNPCLTTCSVCISWNSFTTPVISIQLPYF